MDRVAPTVTRTAPAQDEIIIVTTDPMLSIYVEATIADPRGDRNTAASGLRDVVVNVTNAITGAQVGEAITRTPVDIYANLVVTEYLPITAFGTYRVRTIATDNVGNQTINTFIYIVEETPEDPTDPPVITFMPLAVGNWLNLRDNNALTFTVVTDGGIALRGVTAQVFAQPTGEQIVVGSPVFNNGIYTVNLQGNRIPADANGVKLIVVATDITGTEGEKEHVYDIDRTLPIILTMTPDGATFTTDDDLVVDVRATFSDNIGIASARLVWNVNNELAATTAGVEVITAAITNPQVGQHTLTLTVTDVLGNVMTKETTFTVIEVPVPPTDLDFDPVNPPYNYPNPANPGDDIKFELNLVNKTGNEIITLRVFDFAGRLVYEGPGTTWNQRTNNGVQVGRGTYFARITVNNGTKIVESVVKVSIR
jgi:hypothetical protein